MGSRLRGVAVLAVLSVLPAAGTARAAVTPVVPWAVGAQMEYVGNVTWDATGDALLVSGNPTGDDECCTRGLWLARPDGSGTRLDSGGQEIRGASISADGGTIAWITPGQVEGETQIVVRRPDGSTTSTRLPKGTSKLEALYTNTIVGPTGRVFAVMGTANLGSRIVEIPRGGRGRIVAGQPRLTYNTDFPDEQVAQSPDGRRFAECSRMKGHNVVAALDPIRGRLRTHRVREGYLGYCGITDGGSVASTVSWNPSPFVDLRTRIDVVPVHGRAHHHLVPSDSEWRVGPHAILVGFIGRRVFVAPESGAPRRVAVPRSFRLGTGDESITVVGWSPDGRRAAIAYTKRPASRHGCPAIDRMLVVDVRRHRALRNLTTLPGPGVESVWVTGDGRRVLFTTAPPCRAGAHGAWSVGARSGAPVDLNAAGFSFDGTWDPPGPGTLVGDDRSFDTLAASALVSVADTAQLGSGPFEP